ncbi:MAG: hypothetical protein RLZZ44_866, partial [Bacteroidota bacterium]
MPKNKYVSLAHQKTNHIFTKIALKPLRTNLFNIVLLSFFLTIGLSKVYAQDIIKKKSSIPSKTEVLQPNSNLGTIKEKAEESKSDTIKKDSLKPKKAFLEGKVKYKADNYTKIDQKKKHITLYDKAELYYQDVELKSGIILLDYEKNEVYAGRIKDSTGKFTQFPNFKQGANIIEPDSIRFNFKTK